MLQNLTLQLRNVCRRKMVKIGLKALLILVLSWVLYMQLNAGLSRLLWPELQQFWQEKFTGIQFLSVLIVAALMPLNWSLETRKWVALMKPVEKIDFGKAFRAVLAGLTVSMFTPNRMGEYGGRMLMVSPENRIQSVFATLVGSMSQWLVLVAGGLLGLAMLLFLGKVPAHLYFYACLVMALGLGILVLVAFCYFHLPWFIRQATKWKLTRKWAAQLHDKLFRHYHLKELSKALRLSTFRYLVYSLQYFCLLSCFGFEMNCIACFSAILFIFLLQTGLPIPPSAGLLARSSIALWVFSWFAADISSPLIGLQSAVLASTFVLWLINVLIPAALGGLFIVKTMQAKAENAPIQ